ncbi:MAG: polysaccharide biosynthesis/export family protein [Deltaproteobacteria bacterium]|nr:polysaccharide biosynthesis/export family protein [Deltaproteobacteria bacterium]
MKPKLIRWAQAVGILVVIFGCSHSNSITPPVAGAPAQMQQLVPPYLVQPGDSLDIKFFYNPELNESVSVRPDGYISLQLVDEVLVAGLEPRQVDDLLTERYSRELKKPVITVIVRSFAGQQVFVGGEVGQQGLIAMPTGLTALQAVMQAGGFKNTAQPSETVVIRKGPDNRPVPLQVDLNRVLDGSTNAQDFKLQPSDVVYVPKSPIAKANQFVNQYIEQLFLFRGVSLGFTWELHGDKND